MLAHNVVKLNEENEVIFNIIQNYFNELQSVDRDYQEKESNRTKEAYESDIRLFFQIMRQKPKGNEIEFLTFNDIAIDQDDMEKFVDILCELKNPDDSFRFANKTVNRKIAAMKSFIRYLKKKKIIKLDISYLDLIKSKKIRNNHYGVLEVEEVLEMARLAKEERNKGEIKHILILFALKTGLRVSEILDLKWSNFINRNGKYFIKGIGKGNEEYEIEINTDLYNQVQELNKGQKTVFNISAKRVSDMICRIRDKMGLDNRNIVFHSIRKCFGTTVWKLTGDIEQARRALRHKNITTTQIYLGENETNVNDIIGSIDKIEDDLFEKVSHKDLIEVISKCPKNIQLILNMKIKEILKQNN